MVSASSGISGSAYAQDVNYRGSYSSDTEGAADPRGFLGSVEVINRAIDDAFNQPGSNLVASPKSDKPCYLSDLLAGKSSCDVVGGPWARVMGGQTTTSTTGLVTSPYGDVYGSTTRQRVNFSGVQVGADSGWLNLEGIGVNAHVGVMGGNVSADASSLDSPYPSRTNFEVPFLGAYYVLTKGNFMTDFTYRHSWYIMKVTDTNSGFNNAPLNGQSDNINASVSYKFALPDRYFIEPLANISYTRSTFDSLESNYGVTDVAPVKSLLGRAGLRFGTSFSYGGYNWSPYVLGLVENEFEKSSNATTYDRWGDVYGMSTDRVGTFYQTSLGISFQSQTSGLVGFARGDWQTGHNINGGGVVGGVRYTFGAPAAAADLRTPAYTKAPAMSAGPYDWSGFHVGLNGGYGSSRNCWNYLDWYTDQREGCHDATGGTFGGQIGYRWQAADWVFGLEGQGNWADFKGQHTSVVFDQINQTKIESFGLVTGQVGHAWNNVLLYVKGGAAVVNSKHDVLYSDRTLFASTNDTRWGGTVGAGVDVGFAQNWSLGVEYNHIFLGDRDNTFITPYGYTAEGADRISQDVDMALVRLNYKLGGGAQ